MTATSYTIGIDLGTTNSVVGVFRFGKVEIIANDFGNRLTPSIVGFDETERLIGDSAKQQMIGNPTNTIYGVKRLMGKNFNDADVQKDKSLWPFIMFHNDGKTKIQVTYQKKNSAFSPEEISAMIILKMKQTAEDYLGKPVTDAVITVPAYFNDLQRKATKDAAEIAELNVLSIINEPTAAAIAYGFGNENGDKRNVLIFDLGGGTFDISILEIEKLNFEVIATGGDTHLGGEDFDNRLVQHFLNEILLKHKKDLKSNKKALAKLRRACETAKRTLALQTVAKIEVDSLTSGFDFKSTISRARFEELNVDLFRSTLVTMEKVLSDSNLIKDQIEEIVLVGGSTRIPKIQQLVKNFFNGKEPVKSINPDEAVAFGAAIQAARLRGDKSKEIVMVKLADVTPLSLGIAVGFESWMQVLIKRNTRVPAKFTQRCYTLEHNQTLILIDVYQGEAVKTTENIPIGNFVLTEIPPRPAGEEKVDVTFDIDVNGILQVTAVLVSTGKEARLIINTKGFVSDTQIKKMIQNARKIRVKEKAYNARIQAKNELENYCFELKSSLREESTKEKISAFDMESMLNDCTSALSFINIHGQADKEIYEEKKIKLQRKFSSLMPFQDTDSLFLSE